MTETDRVYVAITETMKKHSVEQAVAGLSKYITEGNARYFTSTNNARDIICELSPAQVLQDALKSSLKYEMIEKEKGHARVSPNQDKVTQAIKEYQSGTLITTQLASSDLSRLMIEMLNYSVGDTVKLLAQNPEVFESFLAQYAVIVCNNRSDLNKLPNENFTSINDYFSQFEQHTEKQVV